MERYLITVVFLALFAFCIGAGFYYQSTTTPTVPARPDSLHYAP